MGEYETQLLPLLAEPDADWIDDELAVDLEVDDELAWETEYPVRLIQAEEDDRFAFGLRDPGSYSAEELAMHLV